MWNVCQCFMENMKSLINIYVFKKNLQLLYLQIEIRNVN